MARYKEDYHIAPSDDEDSSEEKGLAHPISWHSAQVKGYLVLHYTFIGVGYLVLVLFLAIIVAGFVRPSSLKQSTSFARSPLAMPFPSLQLAGALEYESRTLSVNIHNNPYAGKPRPALEEAWHHMFEHTNIRVRKEDLDYYNVTSLPMTALHGNEGYYVAQMGLFHELHCLKRIRHYIYRSHYLVNFTEDQLVEEEAHVAHCLELMREAILCRGDTTLSAFRWINSSHLGAPQLTVDAPGYHTCVNWEKLHRWNNEQAVDPFEPGALAGPGQPL